MKLRKNDRTELYSVPTDVGEKRFSAALIFSLIVNILLLSGASTLLPVEREPQSESADYITLDRIELGPAKAPPPRPSPVERPKGTPSVLNARASIAGAVRHLPKSRSSAASSNEPNLLLDDALKPEVLTNGAKEVAHTPRRETIPDASNTEGAEVATSSILPGEPSSSSPSPPPEAVPSPEPSASVAPQSSIVADTVLLPVGITKSAELSYKELPRLPDEIQERGYRSFVRVKVEVAEDGKFTVAISTSSGNADVDQRVLDALKRWKWKPALKDGIPITSTETYRFDFDVD